MTGRRGIADAKSPGAQFTQQVFGQFDAVVDRGGLRQIEQPSYARRGREESPAAKDAIAQILTNSRMSAEGHRPICQDTGIALTDVDTIDLSDNSLAAGSAYTIDLSTSAGFVRNLEGTVREELRNFENAVGTSGSDTFYGNEGNNALTAGNGADTIHYGAINNALTVNLTTERPATLRIVPITSHSSTTPAALSTSNSSSSILYWATLTSIRY